MRMMFAKLLPRSLSGRMTLILVTGLLASQFASLLLHLRERAAMMAAGTMHSGMSGMFGMPGMDALPLRFLWHVSLTLAVVVLVSLIAVRWATKPLQQMAEAATAFAHNLDAAPLQASGPTEVRRAAEAFNFMQSRLRQLVVERGRALAAVSHDLRTPLTRMRLRAELVDDPALQTKLNADIDAMQGYGQQRAGLPARSGRCRADTSPSTWRPCCPASLKTRRPWGAKWIWKKSQLDGQAQRLIPASCRCSKGPSPISSITR